MANIAELGFGADTRELKQAKRDLEALQPAAEGAEKKVVNFNEALEKTSKNTKRARDENGRFIPSVTATEKAFGDATQKTGAFGKALSALQGIATKASGAFGKMTNKLVESGAAYLAAAFGIGAVINTLAGFETQMSGVAAVSGATGDELEALRDTAKQLGSTTEFSASQAAEGLKLLAMAGYNGRDAISTIPAVLDLATASTMDLGTATDYVASIMAAFGLGVQDAGRATDVLVAASNKANTDVSDLGEGMKYVGPVARALGISIEDTAAAMGILSNAGLKGSQAGTSLRGVLAALANPTKTAREELQRLGISVKDVNPQFNDITSIIDKFAAAGIDASAAFKIFGMEATPALLSLVNNAGDLKKLTGEMQNVAGESSRIASMLRDNLGGSLNGFKSALEGVIIALGEAGLTAAIRAVIDVGTMLLQAITSIVNGFSAVAQFIGSTVKPAFDLLVSVFQMLEPYMIAAALVATATYVPAMASFAASTIAAAVSLTVSMIPALVGLAGSAYTAVAALVTLKGALIATGIGAIVVLVGYLIGKFLELSEKVGGVGNVIAALSPLASDAGQRISDIFKAVGTIFDGVVYQMQATWLKGLSIMANGAAAFLRSMAGGFGAIPGMGEIELALNNAAIAAQSYNYELKNSAADAEKLRDVSFGLGEELIKLATEPSDALDKFKETVKGATSEVTNLNNELSGGDSGGAGEAAAKALSEIQKIGQEFEKLSAPFDQAKATFDTIKSALDNGIISNDEYASSLDRLESAFLRAGGSAQQWAKLMRENSDSVSAQIANLNENAFKQLGSTIADVMTGGSANFKDFAKSLIRDMINIMIQALIVKPILSSLGFGFSSGGVFAGGGIPGQYANGAAFSPSGSVEAFAAGGTFTNSVVNKATPFTFAGGAALGVMGEAGPEAIMPLKRGRDGSLGVQMYGTGAASGGGAPARLELHVTGEPGPLFIPTIRAESQDVAVAVSQQTAQQIDRQLPARVREIQDDIRAN